MTSTAWKMYGGSLDLLAFIVGLLYFIQVVEGQISVLDCPPPFPSFDKFFKKTLQFPDKLQFLNTLKEEAATPENCTYSPSVMENLEDFNKNRCTSRSVLNMECPIPTTTEETYTTTVEEPTTTEVPVVPVITSTPHRTSRVTTTVPASTTTALQDKTPAVVVTQETGMGGERERTSSSTEAPTTTTGGHPIGAVVQKQDDLTVIVIAIGAVILAAVVIAVALLVCRRHSHAYNGAVDLQAKHERVLHQRNGCRPISSTNPRDTFDDDDLPPKEGTPGSIRYNRGYVTNGRKWRPEYDQPSEDGSEKSVSSGKYILLREDSSTSGLSSHYNTLRTIDYPHALILGGFGESSTDMTLPRRYREKLAKQQRALSQLEAGVAETQFVIDPARGPGSDQQKVAAYLSDPLYANGTEKPRNYPLDTVVPVGHGHVPNGDIRRRSDVDRHSLGTIDQADAVLDESINIGGVGNPAFQSEEDEIREWEAQVGEEMDRDATPGHYDSLVNNRNAHLFNYENKGMDSPNLSRPVREEILAPPPEFCDSSPDVSVAVVQPSVQSRKPAGASWLHNNRDSGEEQCVRPSQLNRGSSNTPVGRTAPFSYTPSPNSSLSREEGPGSHPSLPRSTEISLPNGVVTNGKLLVNNTDLEKKPQMNGSQTHLHDQSWIKQNGEKPAAQVLPMGRNGRVL